jgi:SAM-dependent methyltransferase
VGIVPGGGDVSYYSAVTQRNRDPNFAAQAAHFASENLFTPGLDELSLKFAIFTRTARFDALDVGCGDGIATAAALARGGHVMAVDPDQAALHQLLARVPPEQYRRLKVKIGRLPGLDFKFARFSAVHAARVLDLLDPAARSESLRKFFRWLYPQGRLFVSVLAPLYEDQLRYEVESAGFVIEECKSYALPWANDRTCSAAIARCGP